MFQLGVAICGSVMEPIIQTECKEELMHAILQVLVPVLSTPVGLVRADNALNLFNSKSHLNLSSNIIYDLAHKTKAPERVFLIDKEIVSISMELGQIVCSLTKKGGIKWKKI